MTRARFLLSTMLFLTLTPVAPSHAQQFQAVGDFATHYGEGIEHYRAGRYRDAAEAFEKALRLDPGNAVAYNNVGSAYVEAGLYSEAITPLSRAISLRPEMPAAYRNLGRAWYGLGSI